MYILDGCFENGIAIVGDDIQLANSLLSLNDVNNCQRHCQSNLECNYFVFDYDKNVCILKTSDATKISTTKSLVGPKFCGKIITITIKIFLFQKRTVKVI